MFPAVAVLCMCSQNSTIDLQTYVHESPASCRIIRSGCATLLFNVWSVVYKVVSNGQNFKVQKSFETTYRPCLLPLWRPEAGHNFGADFNTLIFFTIEDLEISKSLIDNLQNYCLGSSRGKLRLLRWLSRWLHSHLHGEND